MVRDLRVVEEALACFGCEEGTVDSSDYDRLERRYEGRLPALFVAVGTVAGGWRLQPADDWAEGPIEAIEDWGWSRMSGELQASCPPAGARADRSSGWCLEWLHEGVEGHVYAISTAGGSEPSWVLHLVEQPLGWIVADERELLPRWPQRSSASSAAQEPPECTRYDDEELPAYCDEVG